jgi:hypothetical protein
MTDEDDFDFGPRKVSVLRHFEIDMEPEKVTDFPCGAGRLETFVPETPLSPDDVVGRTIVEIQDRCGTYGMGGAAMMALRLDGERKTSHPQQDEEGEWLIISIWSAEDHLLLESSHIHGWKPLSSIKDWKEKVLGKKILGLFVDWDDLKIVLEDKLSIIFNPINRSELYCDVDEDEEKPADLRKAVFLSPTLYLWI